VVFVANLGDPGGTGIASEDVSIEKKLRESLVRVSFDQGSEGLKDLAICVLSRHSLTLRFLTDRVKGFFHRPSA
jgi:hypothetical protein